MKNFIWLVPIAALACGASSTGSSAPADAAADTGVDGGGAQDGLASVDASRSTGVGTVRGSIGGAPFGVAAGALWIGAPDDPATTVVYVFSTPVSCSDLSAPGWDTRITDATRVLEMKAFGTAPATYTVVTTPTPAPGEASVNYTLSSRTGTPAEQGAKTGTLTFGSLASGVSSQGSFSLGFGASSLSGTFDAVFCPGGHEP